MAVSITLADALVAARIVPDSGAVPPAVTAAATVHFAAMVAIVDRHAPAAPEAVQNAAAVRMLAYLWSLEDASRSRGYTSALRESGATGMLAQWRVKRIGVDSTAASAASSTPGGSGVSDARVAELIAAHAADAGAHHAKTALRMPATNTEADGGTSTTLRAWSAALIRRVVEGIVPAWARQATAPTGGGSSLTKTAWYAFAKQVLLDVDVNDDDETLGIPGVFVSRTDPPAPDPEAAVHFNSGDVWIKHSADGARPLSLWTYIRDPIIGEPWGKRFDFGADGATLAAVAHLNDLTGDLRPGPTPTGWADANAAQGGIAVSTTAFTQATARSYSAWAVSDGPEPDEFWTFRIPAAANPAQTRLVLRSSGGTEFPLTAAQMTRLGASADGNWVYYTNGQEFGGDVASVRAQATGSAAHIGTSTFVGKLANGLVKAAWLATDVAARLLPASGGGDGKLLGHSGGSPAWVDAPAGGSGIGAPTVINNSSPGWLSDNTGSILSNSDVPDGNFRYVQTADGTNNRIVIPASANYVLLWCSGGSAIIPKLAMRSGIAYNAITLGHGALIPYARGTSSTPDSYFVKFALTSSRELLAGWEVDGAGTPALTGVGLTVGWL